LLPLAHLLAWELGNASGLVNSALGRKGRREARDWSDLIGQPKGDLQPTISLSSHMQVDAPFLLIQI